MPRSRQLRRPRPEGSRSLGPLLAPRPRREPNTWVELDDGTRLAAYVTEPSAPSGVATARSTPRLDAASKCFCS